jgi:hypothetical protein
LAAGERVELVEFVRQGWAWGEGIARAELGWLDCANFPLFRIACGVPLCILAAPNPQTGFI